MKKGNVTILASILAITLVAAGVGAGTMAWFSATAVTSGSSTFTAGELKIEVTDNSFHTPTNWAPGDTATFTFTVRNTGNIDIKYMLARDTGYTCDGKGDGSDLSNAILITELHEYVLDDSGNQVADAIACDVVAYEHAICASWSVSSNDKLTLAEWMSGLKPGTSHSSDYDMIMYPPFANVAYQTLKPWWFYRFAMSLQFDPLAGNEYQKDTCSFNIEVYATHGPITSLPGYVS